MRRMSSFNPKDSCSTSTPGRGTSPEAANSSPRRCPPSPSAISRRSPPTIGQRYPPAPAAQAEKRRGRDEGRFCASDCSPPRSTQPRDEDDVPAALRAELTSPADTLPQRSRSGLSALGSCSATVSRATLCPTCRPSSCRRRAGARGPKEPVLASACRSSFRALWSAATKDGLEFVRSRAFRLRLRLLAHRLWSLSFRFTSLSGAGRCGAGFGAGGGLSLMTRLRV
jgi:hypothetical protein